MYTIWPHSIPVPTPLPLQHGNEAGPLIKLDTNYTQRACMSHHQETMNRKIVYSTSSFQDVKHAFRDYSYHIHLHCCRLYCSKLHQIRTLGCKENRPYVMERTPQLSQTCTTDPAWLVTPSSYFLILLCLFFLDTAMEAFFRLLSPLFFFGGIKSF